MEESFLFIYFKKEEKEKEVHHGKVTENRPNSKASSFSPLESLLPLQESPTEEGGDPL